MKKIALLIGIIAFVIFLFFGKSIFSSPIEVHVKKIEKSELVVSVSPTNISTIRAEYEVQISSQIPGEIIYFPFEEGDVVKKDQILMKIDPTYYDIAFNAAVVNIEMAQAKLDISIKQKDLEESQLNYEVAISLSNLELSRKNFERAKNLLGKGSSTEATYDTTKQNYESCLNMYNGKKSLMKKIDLLSAQVLLNKSLVSQTRIEYDKAKSDLEKAVIKSPFDGVISNRYVSVHECQSPGMPLLKIISPDKTYIHSLIDEVDIGKIAKDKNCEITLDAYPDIKLQGKIERISPVITGNMNQAKTFAIRVYVIDSKGLIMKPGQSCDVKIIIEKIPNILTISTQSVIERDGKKIVFLLSENKLIKKEIIPGKSNWESVEVKSGLNPGDVIVHQIDSKEIREGIDVIPVSVK